MRVIINNGAGAVVKAGGAEALAEKISQGFAEAGLPVEVITVAPADLEKTLIDARDHGNDGIVVGGGDGSVATAVRLMRGHSAPLGILPMGTLNLLARDLHLPLDLDEAVAALAQRRVAHIDVAELNGRPFTCVCLLGFYPQIQRQQSDYHGAWWRKSLVVFKVALRSYKHFPPLRLTLNFQGTKRRFRTRLVTVANNAFTHDPGILPSRADLTSGILTVYVSTHRRVWRLLKASLAFMTGMWHDDPDLHIYESQDLRIDCARKSRLNVMLDGELLEESLPLHFTIRPRQLAVYMGQPPAEDSKIAEDPGAARESVSRPPETEEPTLLPPVGA